MLPRVLIATDNPPLRRQLKSILASSDAMLTTVRASKDFWKKLSRESADILIVSRALLPDPMDSTLNAIKETPEAPDVVVITPSEDSRERSLLLAAGAETVLSEDLNRDAFLTLFDTLVDKRRERRKLQLTTEQVFDEPRLSDFVSNSPSMQAFMNVVARVVDSDTSILIQGETGVGKERLARAIHAESPRKRGPFIAINCAALPENLLESELFGHLEGAFTGATRTRRGSFELAHGGTVFLDEIGEMPLHLQAKLLRVLQDREVQPIGSERPIHVDIRVMAATNRNLETSVERKEFRADLYYRLSVVSLTLPPLRERREDISALTRNYVAYFSENMNRFVNGPDEEAMEALTRYIWPGNVRELMNAIERAVLLCRGTEISSADLPSSISGSPSPPVRGDGRTSPALEVKGGQDSSLLNRTMREVRNEAVRKAEIAYLSALLAETRGRVGETAKRAGIETRSLFEKMRKYGLRKEDFRPRRSKR